MITAVSGKPVAEPLAPWKYLTLVKMATLNYLPAFPPPLECRWENQPDMGLGTLCNFARPPFFLPTLGHDYFISIWTRIADPEILPADEVGKSSVGLHFDMSC